MAFAGVTSAGRIGSRPKGVFKPSRQKKMALNKMRGPSWNHLDDFGISLMSKFLVAQEERNQVEELFKSCGQNSKGTVNVEQFEDALTKMKIKLPSALTRELFHKVLRLSRSRENELLDKNVEAELVDFDSFLEFANDQDTLVQFEKSSKVVFREKPFGFWLTFNPETNKVIVDSVSEKKKKEILLKSELYEIMDEKQEHHYVADLLVEDSEDHNDLKELYKILDEMTLPIQMTFKHEINRESLGILSEDEEWKLLNSDVYTKRVKKRQKDVEKAPVKKETIPRHCKYCPTPGTWRYTIHNLFENENYAKINPTFGWISSWIISFVMLLIAVSTVIFILESIPVVYHQNEELFTSMETVISILFTVEYALRAIACRNLYEYFFALENLVDFLAVLPFFIEQSFSLTEDGGSGAAFLRVIRVMRLARILRILKNPYMRAYLIVLQDTIRLSYHSFSLMLTITLLFVVVCSSLMYVVENGVQDDDGVMVRPIDDYKPTHFTNIPISIYWCVVTITTVGYGDMYPVTWYGQLIGALTMIMGLLVIAFPVIIIGGNFEEVYDQFQKKQKREERKLELEQDAKINSVPFSKVQDYFDDLNAHINKACGQSDENFKFFEETDVFAFIDEGYDTQEKIVSLMESGEDGLFFFPKDIQQWKLFVLYEIFGRMHRSTDKSDPFERLRKALYQKLQLAKPLSPRKSSAMLVGG